MISWSGTRTRLSCVDDLAVSLANHYFDGILVHTDPRHHPGRTFQPKVAAPVHHTGFVTRTGLLTAPERDATPDRPYLLASAGVLAGRRPLLRWQCLRPALASDLSRRGPGRGHGAVFAGGRVWPYGNDGSVNANVKNSALDRRHARPNGPRGRLGEPVRLQHDHGPVGVRCASRRSCPITRPTI
ncbi:MAG: hypothetical protein R2854_04460 [Caldilineaceae bacterium]